MLFRAFISSVGLFAATVLLGTPAQVQAQQKPNHHMSRATESATTGGPSKATGIFRFESDVDGTHPSRGSKRVGDQNG
jgi:hypothetical protein